MSKYSIIAIGLLSLALSTSAWSKGRPAPSQQPASKTALKDGPLNEKEVSALQDDLKIYEAINIKFTQDIYKSIRKKTLQNKGEAFFKKPDKFRWKITEPNPEEWVYDGKALLNYFPSKNEAIRYSSKAAKGRNLRELVDIILNFKQLLSKYRVEKAFKKDMLATIDLIPFESGDVEKITVIMDLKSHFIKSLKMGFKGGNDTTLTFAEPSFKSFGDEPFALAGTVKITDAL